MKISLIAAVSKNGIIGAKGSIPWYIPEDLKHFKDLTMGHHLLMGRKTFESIGKALPGRIMLVLTKNKKLKNSDVHIFGDYKEALSFAEKNNEKELFIIGGSEIYKLLLPICDTMYLTKIHKEVKGDILFPKFDLKEWEETSNEFHKEIIPNIEFVTLKKRKNN